MLKKIVLSVLLIFFVSVVCVQADGARIKSRSSGRMKTKNSRPTAGNGDVAQAQPGNGVPAEFQEIDGLSKDIKQTLAVLQSDIEKILTGMRGIAMRKSTLESEKQTIEILTLQSDAKKQGIANLSAEIKNLALQVDDLAVLYRQKDSEFKSLSEKLNELDIKRKGLTELRVVADSFKTIRDDPAALNLSANNDAMNSLHKRIDDILSDASAQKAVEEKAAAVQVRPAGSNVSTELNTAPKWVLDEIKTKGRKVETSYGDMFVAKDGGVTVISIKKENDERFRSAYEKLIKESYEADGMEYFVLGPKS